MRGQGSPAATDDGEERGYVGVLAYNPVHGDYNTVYPRTGPYDLAGALPANWRRPARAADLATAPGRNCSLFAALCKLTLGGSDEGLLTWARTLSREFAGHPYQTRRCVASGAAWADLGVSRATKAWGERGDTNQCR